MLRYIKLFSTIRFGDPGPFIPETAIALIGIIGLLAGTFSPVPTWAASPVWLHRNTPSGKSLTVSLPVVVERTMHDNLDIMAAQSRVGSAQGNLIQSFAPLLPSIRGLFYVERFKGGEVIYGGQPISLDRTTYRPTLFADYTIQTGGKPLFQIHAARLQYQRSRLGVSSSGQKALLDACSGYFTWLKDMEQERLAQAALTESESRMRLGELRLEAGTGARLDVMRSQTQVRERKNELLSIRNERDFSAIVLLNHLNLPLDLPLHPDGGDALLPMQFWTEPEDVTPDTLFRMAEARRPDVKSLMAQIREAKAQLGSAWADLFPSITLSGYTRRIGPSPDQLQKTNQRALSISVDVLRNMGVNVVGGIRTASARVREAALNHARQLQDVQQSISQAFLDYRLYRDQMSLEVLRCRETEETARIARERLDAGLALNVEVLQAETARVSAKSALQTAIANYNIAQLRLLYETGQLTPDAVLSAKALPSPLSGPSANGSAFGGNAPLLAGNPSKQPDAEAEVETVELTLPGPHARH